MKLLKGKGISEKILRDLKKKIKREKLKPGLAVFLVGHDKASEVYVGLKQKAAHAIGIKFLLYRYKEKTGEREIIQKIKEINQDNSIHGIIVQLPLPKKFNTQKIINSIDPKKDADGFHPKNVRKFVAYKSEIWPVLPHAAWQLIKNTGVKTKNKKALVLANSDRFGEVMQAALRNKGIKANYILTKNIAKNLKNIKTTDVLVSAVGKPGLIKGDMLKKNVIVIDGGITKTGKKVLGDADIESVKKVAGYLTPVPGGVGPVTIACLLENVYLAAKKSR